MNKGVLPILMVDDDKDDQFLTQKALQENRVLNPVVPLVNGEELVDYLQHRGRFSTEPSPTPCFILLDLNMPKMDGRKALEIIKADPKLRKIPVVILTTSKAEEDIIRSYNLGANSFITKPILFESLVGLMASLKQYWLEIVELPPSGDGQERS